MLQNLEILLSLDLANHLISSKSGSYNTFACTKSAPNIKKHLYKKQLA